MAISVNLDDRTLSDAKIMLAGIENGFVRAYARALNSANTGMQTDMVAIARDDYRYKISPVKARMRLERATWSKLSAKVTSVGSGVLLSDFLGTRQTSTGLTVNVKTSTGLQRIKHAFLNKNSKTGKLLSLRRRVIDGKRADRYPVDALYGPHPEVVWNTRENWDKLSDKASTRLSAAFQTEIDAVIRQYT